MICDFRSVMITGMLYLVSRQILDLMHEDTIHVIIKILFRFVEVKMLDIFVSYSRKNLLFVEHLAADLGQQGKDIWLDKKKEPLQGIPSGSRWWDAIKNGIETSDNFLIIVSPESMASPYCHAEISHAIKHERRIVPLLYCENGSEDKTIQAINDAIDNIDPILTLPSSVSADIDRLRLLASRNWLEISEVQFVRYLNEPDWHHWLRSVIDAVDLDIHWIRTWGQFRQAVHIWVETGKDKDYLWAEKRLKPIRENIKEKSQKINVNEQEFLRSEQKHLYDELRDIRTSHQRRFAIGERLALIGDTRLGVGLDADGLPEFDWLPVQGNTEAYSFHYGKFIVSDFFISRYLVTYQQYDAFFEKEYNNLVWWDGNLQEDQIPKLSAATNANTNAPRDSISWYQSIAFSKWVNKNLSDKTFTHPNGEIFRIGDNAEIRLPTEWEWQWAAQNGRENRVYPWGKWDNLPRANTTESGIQGRSTIVGLYPDGAAFCGATDMTGNLYEWCLNDKDDAASISIKRKKSVRGGSFIDYKENCTTSSRGNLTPQYGSYNSGFRLVISMLLSK